MHSLHTDLTRYQCETSSTTDSVTLRQLSPISWFKQLDSQKLFCGAADELKLHQL